MVGVAQAAGMCSHRDVLQIFVQRGIKIGSEPLQRELSINAFLYFDVLCVLHFMPQNQRETKLFIA